jgi:hypothetical protein
MTDGDEQEPRSFSVTQPENDEQRFNNRRTIRVKHDRAPLTDGCVVALTIDQGWGNSNVYCELTPTEARRLAYYLRVIAREGDEL